MWRRSFRPVAISSEAFLGVEFHHSRSFSLAVAATNSVFSFEAGSRRKPNTLLLGLNFFDLCGTMEPEILNVFTDIDERRILRKVDFRHDDPWVLDTAHHEVGTFEF